VDTVSVAMLAWTAAWTAVAAVACVQLLRAASHPDASVRNGYRWFAVAAACLAAGAALHQAFGGLIGGALPLRLADLISLAALPALVIGLATLTAGYGEPGPPRVARSPRDRAGDVAAPVPRPGLVVDACLLAGSLFVILLVTLFGPDYARGDVGRAAFALALVRPMADLAALGLVLRFAVRSVRLTLAPVLALAAVTIGDALAVADRTSGHVAGLGTQIALLVALALLAAAPLTASILSARRGTPSVFRLVRTERSWSSPATIPALVVAAVAAVVVAAFAVAGRPLLAPPLALAGTAVVFLLVARLAGLTRQATAVAEAAQESDWMFRALAATASDAVLICDLAGTIEYASRAVADFGYVPDGLVGRPLAEIVHPEDRPSGVRAAIAALRAKTGVSTFAGRARGADGSWRHVESTLSRYGAVGEPARLLISSRDVSDRVALRRQLTQLTFHDGLTGLPNRAYLEERIKDLAAAGGDQVGAILIDFDGYAAVNDLVGHAGGDLVLAQAGRRLRAAVPPAATVARWGGDEFAVLVSAADSAADVLELAGRLAGVIAAEPFSVAAKHIALTASAGAAATPSAAAEDVLSNARLALAKAQQARAGRVEVFAAGMREAAQRQAELAADLRLAVAEGRLSIEYLPVVELASSTVLGVEAVVRWVRDGEVVGAEDFLAIAEETGLIIQIGEWVLRQACKQVAGWRAEGMRVWLSVGCTARQVLTPGFVPAVMASLEAAQLPPGMLMIEVAERVLADSTPPVEAELAGLRGEGVKLAIDSFGAGRASLSCLRRSAADVVKIDASYVAGLDSDPTLALLAETIIRLARDLGVEVIAEGVERPEQRAWLEAKGCALGQGACLAGPLPAGPLPTLDSAVAAKAPGGAAEDTACRSAG
jgi:diguanylate cyclase (GGDEF)-like protein/PAS domain S-box-containing protein